MVKKKDSEAATPTGFEPMAAAAMAVNPVAAKAWLDVMSESARFVSERLQKDMEAQTALLACKTPAELMAVQSEFIQTAMEQYTEEVTRFYKMMSKATEDTINDSLKGHSRGYDDVPL